MNISYADVGEFVKKGLEALAENLKVPVETVWGWALKQNEVYKVHDVMWIVLFGIILLVGLGFLINVWVTRHKDIKASQGSYCSWDDAQVTFFVIGAIGVVAGIIGLMVFGQDLAARIINPEWSTVQDLMEKFKELLNGPTG